jgi:HrpA-like RNA helicase
VILATNIAETSVTINGIRFVVDPGLVKARIFNAKLGLESLQVTQVSKAAARQRMGRAGRERHGVCYRLYPEDQYGNLDDQTVAEIHRTNLGSVILQMKSIGIEDIFNFPYIQKPPVASLRAALALLYTLGALTPKGTLSAQGKTFSDHFLTNPQARKCRCSLWTPCWAKCC